MDNRIANDMISSGMIPSGEKKKEDLGRTQYGSAPSPSALADVYKKMYEVDEEIDPMDLGKSKRTLQQKQQARANQQIRRGNLPTGAPPGAENVEQGKASSKDMGSNSQTISKPKKKDTQSKGFGESSVDLLAAYNAVYEHHKKDADGNTIPHEGEELNELKTRTMLDYIDKASDSASKELGKAEKTTSRKKEVKARLKMDKRERGIEMAKDKIMKRVKEEYDLVYEHFIGEGFSEEETFEKMSNLTEEQLDEFMKALATRAAQYGANLGKPASQKINVINPKRKPFEPIKKEEPRKPFDAKKPEPKPGDSDFRAKSASDVVNAAAAMRRKDPVKNTKTGSRTNKTEDVDLFDVVSGVFVAEGYEEKDAYKVMSQLTEEQLNEIAVTGTIATLGAGLLKGMLGAGKVAAAAGKGLASAGKAAAVKGMTAAKSAASGLKSVAKTGMTKASDALGKVSNIAKDKTKGMGDTMKNIGKSVGDDVKNEIKRKMVQDDGGSNKITKTGQLTAPTANINSSADLFDIIKGQLLDERMSEEEIKDIMLTLTPDEILNEISVGKMADYISAADKDVQKTAASMRKDSSVKMDDPRIKKMTSRAKGMAMAGDKIASKATPPLIPLPRTEEYKNFDPKNPDPKQVKKQAEQEKNRQKFNDPLGVKNRNIGGQGLDPMDK